MISAPDSALQYCRARSRPLYDASSGTFLGTSSAVAPNVLLTCNHLIGDRSEVKGPAEIYSVLHKFPCLDLATIRTFGEPLPGSFIVSSRDIEPLEQVIIYGYRTRDDKIVDAVHFASIGSASERVLAPNCAAQKVFGFSSRNLVELGMSGAAVLRASSYEMLGYIVGYDVLESAERKDDVFVPLSSEIASNVSLREHLTFSHQHRAILINTVRRLMSLAGYLVNADRLGDEPGLQECLVCVHGTGVLEHVFLVIAASGDVGHSQKQVEELHDLAIKRAESRHLHFDKVIVIVEEDSQAHLYLEYAQSLKDLKEATPSGVRPPVATSAGPLVGLIGGSYLERLVQSPAGDSPESALEAIETRIRDGAKIVVLTGPTDSGKRTILEIFQRNLEGRFLSGGADLLNTVRIELAAAASADIASWTRPISEHTVVLIDDFEKLWTSGDSALAIRALRALGTELNRNFRDWSIILSFGGDTENIIQTLPSVVEGLIDQSRIVALELLPLSGELIRHALFGELGSTAGQALWKTVSSSQEIFQIAQWPSGLSVLLDRIFQASWDRQRASQIHVIAAIVNGFLSRGRRNNEDMPPSVTLQYLIQLAKDMNATQQIAIPLSRARRIYADAALKTGNVHNIAVNDLLAPGLLASSTQLDALRFENPVFLHYFLALAIMQSVEANETGAHNPLFHRRLPIALLTDTIHLGLDERLIRGMLASIAHHKNELVGFIGGNCISLLRILGANLRDTDLSATDLRGAIFAGCDLSYSNLSNCELIDVGFANARLDHTSFAAANLYRADLKSGCTVYQLLKCDDSIFAATSLRRLLRIRTPTTSPALQDIEGFTDAVFAVAASARERLLIAGGQDGTVRGWDYVTGEPKFVLRGHFSDIRTLAFAGNRIVSGSVDGQINVWAPWSATLLRSICPCGGQIWNLSMLSNTKAVALCDRAHLHIINVIDGTTHASVNLPQGHSRRLVLRRSSSEVFVGGPGWIWSLDIDTLSSTIREVPHSSIRTLIHLGIDGILIGGAYGKIIWATNDLSRFADVPTSSNDYISDFSAVDSNLICASDASGRIFFIGEEAGQWGERGAAIMLDHDRQLSVNAADFRGVENLPEERLTHLAKLGAIVN